MKEGCGDRLGLVTPLGTGVQKTWDALCAGKSGIRRIEKFDPSPFPVRSPDRCGLPVRGFHGQTGSETFDIRSSCRGCGTDGDGGVRSQDRRHQSASRGVPDGIRLGGLAMLEHYHRCFWNRDPAESALLHPGHYRQYGSGQIAIQFGVKGLTSRLNRLCASCHAVGESMSLIREGKADAMIAGDLGGGDSLALGGFCSMRALSTRNDEPEKAPDLLILTGTGLSWRGFRDPGAGRDEAGPRSRSPIYARSSVTG